MVDHFWHDWMAIVRARLISQDYDVGVVPSEIDVVRYFNVLRRRIEPRSRVVLTSREFECPHEHQQVIQQIWDDSTAGRDLNPRQSRLLLSSDYNDKLLFDWGVHHLHLGSTNQSDGFLERTGALLFCRVDDDRFYMICVGSHKSWTEPSIMETIERNWPELVEPRMIPGTLALVNPVSAEDTSRLRKAHVNTFRVGLDGRPYVGLGGGYTATGVSIDVMLRVFNSRKACRSLDRRARKHLGSECLDGWCLRLEDGVAYADKAGSESLCFGQTPLK